MSAYPDPPPDSPLSPGQHYILQLLARGMTTKQIALRLGVSDSSVRTHLHGAYARLGVTNQAQAVGVFLRDGWDAPPPPMDPRSQPREAAEPSRAGRAPFPLPPFAGPYLHALDRHLADGDDQAAKRDLSVAAIGLTHRKPAPRDRDAFLDRVLHGLGHPPRRTA